MCVCVCVCVCVVVVPRCGREVVKENVVSRRRCVVEGSQNFPCGVRITGLWPRDLPVLSAAGRATSSASGREQPAMAGKICLRKPKHLRCSRCYVKNRGTRLVECGRCSPVQWVCWTCLARGVGCSCGHVVGAFDYERYGIVPPPFPPPPQLPPQ